MAQSSRAKAASVLAALALWQIAAVALGQSFLLASPAEVARELVTQLPQGDFWRTIWYSLGRIFAGFALAMALGGGLAAVSHRFRLVRVLLWPYITVAKSTPVASFIILCLIWLDSGSLSVFATFLIVLPFIYSNVLEGLAATDAQLVEMAKVFRVGLWRRIRYIYLPQLRPYLLSAGQVSIGMAWKAGIAAEVIGIPSGSIGERLYQAKIYLSSAELFSWTVVIIAASAVFEKLFLWGLKAVYNRLEGR